MPYIGQSPATGEANSFKTLDNIASYTLTFDGSSASTVSVANDTITERNHRFVTGQRVTYNDGGGTSITGLSDGVYYIIVEDKHTIKLATNANNAAAGTAINLTGLGVGTAHTLNVAFDGVNTKFKATINNGTRADITSAPQLMLSINGVLQQPHNNTTSPTTGYAVDHTSTIIFSAAPATSDQFFASLVASSAPTFDISDNVVDNFTGDGSTTDFTLSKAPPNNESVLVTIDGVVQYPDDTGAVRAYTVSENILTFASAPGSAVEIQVRHIGFAGASTGGISGFYGRTGNAVLKNTDNIVFNNATASGTVQAANVTVTGDLTVNGTTTTLDTELTSVDKLEVDANNTTVAAAITQRGSGDILNLYDGSTEVFSVLDGGAVRIGGNAVSGAAAGVVLQDGTGVIATRSSASSPVFRGYTQGDSSANFTVRADGKLLLGTETEGISGAHNLTIGESGHGGITIRTGTTSAGAIYFADSTSGDAQFDGFIQYNQQTRYLRFGTAQVERLRIDAAGNVGINSIIPRSKLHVASGTSGYNTGNPTGIGAGAIASIESNGTVGLQFLSGNSHNNYIYFGDTNSATTGSIQYSHGANALIFNVNGGTERLRITSNGLIGIGTVTPARLLHLHETSSSATLLAFTNTTTGSAASDGALIGIQDNESLIVSNKENNHIEFHTNNTERFRISSTGQVHLNGATGKSTSGTSATDLLMANSAAIRFRKGDDSAWINSVGLDSNNNLKLGWGGSTSEIHFGISGIGDHMKLDSGGRLIIGSATSSNAWAGGDNLIIGNTTSGTRSGITLVSGSDTDGGLYWSDGNSGTSVLQGQLVYNHSNSRMQFYTAASARVTIDAAGRLLIGRVTHLQSSAERLTVDSGMGIIRNNSTSTGALYLRNEDSTADTRHPYLIFTDGSGNRGGIGIQNDASSMWIHGQNGIAFRTTGTSPGSAERLRIHSSGATTMHVNNADHDTFRFTTQGVDEAKLIMRDASDNEDIVLNTGGNSWINNGSFGIGTNNPQKALHIVGNSAALTKTNGLIFFSKDGEGVNTNTNNTHWIGRVDNAGYHATTGAGGFNSVAGSLAIGAKGPIMFATSSATDTYSSGRMLINGAGLVGINESSPSKRLSINNGTTDGDIISMYNDNVGINFGAWGTGHGSYPREVTINGTRFDSGASPYLRIAGQGGIKFCADLNNERMRIRPTGQVEIHSNGNYGNNVRALSIGSRTSASYQGSLAIARGEAIGGGTGPLMEFVHGPDGGTQRVHQIFSYIGDLKIFADAAENLELSGVETKIKDSSRNDVAIFNANGLEMEKNTARLFGRYVGRTNTSMNYELTHWTAGSFRILEVFGFINPNAAGSGAYHDPAHFYVYNATGWNGSSISYYLGIKHVAPGARTYAPSGTGNDPTQNIVAKWGNNNSTATTNGSHYLKFEWSGANNSNNYQAYFRVIRRM